MTLTRRGKAAMVLLTVLVLIGGPVLAVVVWVQGLGVTGGGDGGRRVKVEIVEGSTTTDIGEQLEDQGIIKSALGFRLASYLHSGDESIQAGSYTIPTDLSARRALDLLLEGPELKFITITFPEGSWVTEFAATLNRDSHVSGRAFTRALEGGKVESSLLPKGSNNFEGLLFPSTYQIVEDDSAQTIAQRLVDEMEKRVAAATANRSDNSEHSTYELVTIASMIQAESRLTSEYPKIARVIYNRLDQEMLLGIDATVIYALGERVTSLGPSELAIDSPYNTRKVPGLPPTPIGAPGAAALRAAVNPADGEWLYYVLADCDGNHAFSKSYDQFLQDKAAYQDLSC